jgi:hypothetical protein
VKLNDRLPPEAHLEKKCVSIFWLSKKANLASIMKPVAEIELAHATQMKPDIEKKERTLRSAC